MATRNRIVFSITGKVREVFQRDKSEYVNIIIINEEFNEVFNLIYPNDKFTKTPLKKDIKYRFTGNLKTREWEPNKVSTTWFLNDIAPIISETETYKPAENNNKSITKPLL